MCRLPALFLTLVALAPAGAQTPLDELQAKALTDLQQAGRLARGGGEADAVARLCAAALSRYDEVLHRLGELAADERAEVRALSHYNAACGEALRGRTPAALGRLGRAIDAGFEDWRGMQADPDLTRLRDQPGFKRLVRVAYVEASLGDLYVLGFQSTRALTAGRDGDRAQLPVAHARAEAALKLASDLYASDFSQDTALARFGTQLLYARALQGDMVEAGAVLDLVLETGLVSPQTVLDDKALAPLHARPALTRRAADRAEPTPAARLDLTWTWTFADDLTPTQFAAQERVIRIWAANLWQVSEGNVHLAQVTLRDRAERVGELHTPIGLLDAPMLTDETYAMTLPGMLLIPGSCGAFTFVHEVGHLLFWLPEEYDTQDGCPCAQAGERGRLTWCDAETHSASQRALGKAACWPRILARYPQLRHPGPGGEAPPLKVVSDDR